MVAVSTLLSLTAVYLLHRLSSGPGGRRRIRGARAGALLLVGGLCCTGLAFGQPQEAQEAQEAQEEASAALEEARETLDEALEEAGEQAQDAIEGAIERLEDLERDLNGIEGELVVDLDNRVAFGSTVRVGRDEVVNDIVSIGGDVKVDGQVRGDAVSVGGEAKINGRVTGEVVAIGGDVELGPEAEVFGDIVTVGGRVRREDGSSVLGEVSEVAWDDFDWNFGGDWFDGWDGDWFPGVGDRPPFFRLGKVFEFVQSIIFTFLLIALSGLVLLVAPKGVGRVRSAAASDLGIMFAVGLGVEVFFIPVLVIVSLLLAVTIIGIPFAVLVWPAAFIGLAAAFVFGYAGIGGGGRRLVPPALPGRRPGSGRQLRRSGARRPRDPGARTRGRPARLSGSALVLPRHVPHTRSPDLLRRLDHRPRRGLHDPVRHFRLRHGPRRAGSARATGDGWRSTHRRRPGRGGVLDPCRRRRLGA